MSPTHSHFVPQCFITHLFLFLPPYGRPPGCNLNTPTARQGWLFFKLKLSIPLAISSVKQFITVTRRSVFYDDNWGKIAVAESVHNVSPSICCGDTRKLRHKPELTSSIRWLKGFYIFDEPPLRERVGLKPTKSRFEINAVTYLHLFQVSAEATVATNPQTTDHHSSQFFCDILQSCKWINSRLSQISTFVINLTGSGLVWSSEALRFQWYHFSRIDLFCAARISTQVLKFFIGAKKIKFSIPFHFAI